MKRGELWWADLPAPTVHEITPTSIRNAVTVAFVTTTIRNIPTEVPLGPDDGLPKQCVVNLDVINTIPKAALSLRVSTLLPAKLAAVAKAIQFALDL